MPILVLAGMFSPEHFEECLDFNTVIKLEHILYPTPIVLIECQNSREMPTRPGGGLGRTPCVQLGSLP
jgi:hypothetical protein